MLISCGSSSACGEGAGGAAAVADGGSCRAEDEPGPGPSPGSFFSLPHPPLDQWVPLNALHLTELLLNINLN